MNGAIHITWRANVPGREATGLEVFGAALARFEGLAKEGRIDSHEEYFAVTGPEGGFMLVRGNLDELLRIAAEPETLALNAQASAIVQDFQVQIFGGGTDQAIGELMTNYSESLAAIGYL
jgi:hypothetical protein